ncbi:MAG: putative cation transport protein ChaC [Pseudomonadota bacterium]|jgi:cation transport protein ChaC
MTLPTAPVTASAPLPPIPQAPPMAGRAIPPRPAGEIPHPSGADLWVFAYGSLMWNPGFPFTARVRGLLRGWHRGFCVYSWRHRGTPEVPGAVLGLDRGGACRGVAYRIAAGEAEAVLDYLWDREMLNRVYHPRRVRVVTADGPVEAVAFTVDRTHRQYCGRLPPDDLARLIRQGVGQSGRAVDYLHGLIAHLAELGIQDDGLTRVAALVDAG